MLTPTLLQICDYGVDDEDSDLHAVPDSIGVNVPHIGIGLPENCIEILNSLIDPVADGEQYGIDIYVNTLSARTIISLYL